MTTQNSQRRFSNLMVRFQELAKQIQEQGDGAASESQSYADDPFQAPSACYEEFGCLKLLVLLPGVDPESVRVCRDMDDLVVSAISRPELLKVEHLLISTGRSFIPIGNWEAKFYVDHSVFDLTQMSATIDNGLLTVTLPKRPAAIYAEVQVQVIEPRRLESSVTPTTQSTEAPYADEDVEDALFGGHPEPLKHLARPTQTC